MKLEEYIDSCDAHMLKAAGVYAILNEDKEVMYVGETESFIRRWGEHCSPIRSKTVVPLGEIFEFVVIAYEDSRLKRLEMEAAWRIDLEPKYGRGGWAKTEINPIRRREYLRFLKLNNLPPAQSTNTCGMNLDDDSALEDELRHLNTKID